MKSRSRNPLLNRVIALALIGLFAFQISRVYFVTKVDAFFICLNTDVWTSTSPIHNEASTAQTSQSPRPGQLILESFPAPADDGGNYLRGCKDPFDDMGLSPLQPSVLPANGAVHTLAITWIRLPRQTGQPPEIFISPLFQPPRSLS